MRQELVTHANGAGYACALAYARTCACSVQAQQAKRQRGACKFSSRVDAAEPVDPVLRIHESVAILVEEGEHCASVVLCQARIIPSGTHTVSLGKATDGTGGRGGRWDQ